MSADGPEAPRGFRAQLAGELNIFKHPNLPNISQSFGSTGLN
jgi:hypothetical protein